MQGEQQAKCPRVVLVAPFVEIRTVNGRDVLEEPDPPVPDPHFPVCGALGVETPTRVTVRCFVQLPDGTQLGPYDSDEIDAGTGKEVPWWVTVETPSAGMAGEISCLLSAHLLDADGGVVCDPHGGIRFHRE